jgi:hypothetical protein
VSGKRYSIRASRLVASAKFWVSMKAFPYDVYTNRWWQLQTMRRIFLYITFFLVLSCQTSNFDGLVGKYSIDCFGIFGSKIELKKDSSFNFLWYQGLLEGETIGTWDVSRNKLILNSNDNDLCRGLIHLNNNGDNLDFITIKLFSNVENFRGVGELRLVMEGKESVIKVVNDDEIFIKGSRIDTLETKFIGFTPLKAVDIESNEVIIHSCKEEPYVSFENESWKIRKNGFIDPKIKKEKCDKKYYTKIE